jgi:hypothetical protein
VKIKPLFSAAFPVAVILLVFAPRAGAEEIVLAKDGVATLPIVASESSAPAEELSTYLSRMSGAKFTRLPEAQGDAIFVGKPADFPRARLGIDGKLGTEEFVVRSAGGSLYLIGGGEQGVSHAVVTLLQQLGCRWYFPGQSWEEIPKKTTLRGAWELRDKPDFSLGRRIWYGFGAYAKSRADGESWNRHNRMGGPEEVSIGHTWAGLNPDKDFATHPEWFAFTGGKRSAEKPCYSHPEVVKKMIDYARKGAEFGQTCITLSAPDGLGFCECERCRAVFKGAEPFSQQGTLFAKQRDGTTVNITSETLFGAVNQVADAVCKDHPNVTLACYAYSAYSHPPSFALHPNVYIQTTTAYRRTQLDLTEQLSQFGTKAEKLGIREYYSVFQWDWDWPQPGKMVPDTLQKDLRFFRANGIDAINAEASNNWAARGLGYYLAAQLMWDVDADMAPLLADFYTGAFGPASKAMERYFVRWYGASAAASDPAGLPAQAKAFDKETDIAVLRDAFLDLESAVKATAEGEQYRIRVDDLRCYLHYLLLRYRLELAQATGQRDQILAAIRAETEFGGRLSDTNMIHTRALIGKAFPRRFRNFSTELEGIDTKEWRAVGVPPGAAELGRLWDGDRRLLGL